MKSFYKPFLILGMFSPSITFSGEKIPTELYCDDTKLIISALRKEYLEIPILFGKADDIAESTMSFWMNSETKTWTILATKGSVSCVIGTGQEFKMAPTPQKSI